MSNGSMAASLRELSNPQGGKVPSLSGHERNPFFLNENGKSFRDISLVSGADSELDGRAVVTFDYNHDGLLDLAVCNANAPKLSIFKNQLGKLPSTGNFVMIRFVGGNQSSQPSADWSARDGYGCVVTASIGGLPMRLQHRCGTGYAAQSSALMHIGLGQHDQIDQLKVRWPSGKRQSFSNISSGTLITLSERDGKESQSYR